MKNILLSLFLVFCFGVQAQIKLPLIFADDMVLQRNKPIPIWGWSSAHENIEIKFHNQTITTQADSNGKWSTKLEPEVAGGPFSLIISGIDKVELQNILIGDVWICSGQSNMEFPVSGVINAKQEIESAEYPEIRQFWVGNDMSGIPKSHLKEGKWTVSKASTVADFTAVGYFFAKRIHQELNIPIGLINTTWGGTCVETWTSQEAFRNSNDFKEMIEGLPEMDLNLLLKQQKENLITNLEKLQGSSVSKKNEDKFKYTDFDDHNWPEMEVPKLWENQQLQNLDGTVWLRKTMDLTKDDVTKSAVLKLGKIDDDDITYVNGIEIGRTQKYDVSRMYNIPKGILKPGKNVIAVRVIDYVGGGGIYGEPSEIKLILNNKGTLLAGTWKFKVVEALYQASPNKYPSLLYNAMLKPLIPYTFKGVLWYQGEANVGRAMEYKKSFPLLIKDWRQQWNQGDFPFYFVQLSSFNEFNGNSKTGSMWAELREAQSYTSQTIPNTEMCVTIDIGNAKDIHPTNKQDVGQRLASIALHNEYGKDIVYQGPIYKSMKIKGPQIEITFNHVGSGLVVSGSEINGFEISGTDHVFHPAKVTIKDKNKIIVYNPEVSQPIAVRYGWADDAGAANLYNKEEFPASPFRTDDWKTLTANSSFKIIHTD